MRSSPALMLLLAFVITGCATPPPPIPACKATTPESRMQEAWWKSRHEAKLQEAKKGPVDLLFIGDSITHGFESGGKAMWEQYYAPRRALNIGYSGDRTEQVLWRLDNGEVDGLAPRLAVIMIGTNNTGHRKDPPAEIAAGVQAILAKLRVKLPKTKVLLLGIFPRGEKADDALRVNNTQANALLAKLADKRRVFFLDISASFLQPDGTLPRDIMPDLLHPNAKGYELWAQAIEPTVAKLLGEKPKPAAR